MKSTVQRVGELFGKFLHLEQYQDQMDSDEIDSVFYVTDGFLEQYLRNVTECRGSLNFILANGPEEVEAKVALYEKISVDLYAKFNKESL